MLAGPLLAALAWALAGASSEPYRDKSPQTRDQGPYSRDQGPRPRAIGLRPRNLGSSPKEQGPGPAEQAITRETPSPRRNTSQPFLRQAPPPGRRPHRFQQTCWSLDFVCGNLRYDRMSPVVPYYHSFIKDMLNVPKMYQKIKSFVCAILRAWVK